MKRKVIKSIALALLVCTTTIVGANITPVNAQTIDTKVDAEVDAEEQVIEVKNFKDSLEKINKCITITNKNIIFDKEIAANEGFSNKEIKNLDSLYDEMNQMVKDNKASIVKTSNGYDITVNANQHSRHKRSIITTKPYGIYLYFSASECADAAAILAGGAATTAAIAGVLGLTGNIPDAIVTTIAAGVMGLGSSYLWYCSNKNGLDAKYELVGGVSFHRNNN